MTEGGEAPRNEVTPGLLPNLRARLASALHTVLDRRGSQPLEVAETPAEPEPQLIIPQPRDFRPQALETLQDMGEPLSIANIRKTEVALRMCAIMDGSLNSLIEVDILEDVESLCRTYRYFRREKKRLEQSPEIKKAAEPVPGCTRYQHSTYNPLAKNILSTGLETLSYTALSDTTHKLTNNYETNLWGFINRWRAPYYPCLVLIRLPKLKPADQALLDELNKRGGDWTGHVFLEKIPGQKRPEKIGSETIFDARIPTKYIEGYIDFDTNEFVQNPSFNPTISEESYKNIVGRLKKIKSEQDRLRKKR